MNTPRHESPVVRFLDNFLQEKNIRWVLAAGMLILLGSSLMMVMPSWTKFHPTWKYFTIMAYTGLIFLAGRLSYEKLALRKTGTGLLALTVLLIPVTSMAWHWLWGASDTLFTELVSFAFLAGNAVVSVAISRLVFRHFLRGDQPTFVASYVILSLAGGVAPIIHLAGPIWSWLSAFALWCVFSIGAVKVNRHVFWLTEEHRKPRIFGFFPIMLLGTQFLTIFAVNFATTMSPDWIGFGCILVAIPVLLTADAVAKVFIARTGNIVRPIPWTIMLPLVVGLMLCVAGIAISLGWGLSELSLAIVPSAALAAMLMALVARRTQRTAFVWSMIACAVLAYNFLPTFFQSAARAAISHGAAAISESRLPFAFYGLTYLPLIAGIAVAAKILERRGDQLFVTPLRRFSIYLSVLLLGAAFGHEKAILPVAAAMTIVFSSLTVLYQSRQLATGAIAAFLVASSGATPFAASVLGWAIPERAEYFILLFAAGIMLAASPFIDSRLNRIPLGPVTGEALFKRLFGRSLANSSIWRSLTCAGSCITAILLAVAWPVQFLSTATFPYALITAAILTLLFVHTLVWKRAPLSWFTYAFALEELLRFGIAIELEPSRIVSTFVFLFLAQFAAGQLFKLEKFPSRVSEAWRDVNQYSSLIGLSLSVVFVAIPDLVMTTVGVNDNAWVIMRSVALTFWCFYVSRYSIRLPTRLAAKLSAEQIDRFDRDAISTFTLLGWVSTLGIISSMIVLLVDDGIHCVPLAWTVVSLGALSAIEFVRRRTLPGELIVFAGDEAYLKPNHRQSAVIRPIELTAIAILGLVAAFQLVHYLLPIRVAGYLAVAGLIGLGMRQKKATLQYTSLALLNWTILQSVVLFTLPNRPANIFQLLNSDSILAAHALAFMAAASLIFWRRAADRTDSRVQTIALSQTIWLRIAVAASLVVTLSMSFITPLASGLAVLTFILLIADELRSACIDQDERRVWFADVIAITATCYLLWFHVIPLGHSLLMYAVLVGGLLIHVAGLLSARNNRTKVLSDPLLRTARWMPLATVAIGILRHFNGGTSTWLGADSLAILMAGGFYFWQAIETRSKRFALLAATVMNIALMLLWRELKLSDPQFYMVPIGFSILLLVEVLKREIPAQWHNPLRYAGALTILVSPTFHIISGSWLHMFTLMIASTLILLASIGLRIRALMYTGIAFLIADLIGMIVCGGLDHPTLLWVAGIGFGGGIVALGAYCEHHREKLLQRMRILSTQLEQWQ